MCGIVGYVGKQPAVKILISGLKRLEYRGYDSAGVAYFDHNKIVIQKAEGKLENVEKLIAGVKDIGQATCGIGHTRWATHGKPTTQNAHPHQTGHVVLVHNGIIENFNEIKAEILKMGHHPQSETDSELLGFLILEEMKKGRSLVEAVRNCFQRIQGQSSVVVMSSQEPGTIVGVRNGSPLVAAIDPKGGACLASDAQPLLDLTSEVYFMDHGDVAVATKDGITFLDVVTGKVLRKEKTKLDWSSDKLDKQGFAHYMLKEIYEQPTALIDTLNGLLDRAKTDPFPLAVQPGVDLLQSLKEIAIVACGTSWHAASVGKYWIEKWARIPVSVELASEYRYRSPVWGEGAALLGITQSGETADTLAVIREARKQQVGTLGITNVRGSTVTREANATFFTSAGPEIGVAATKTFLAQLLSLFLFAGFLRVKKEGQTKEVLRLFDDVLKLPHVLSDYLTGPDALGPQVKRVAHAVGQAKGFFFIGRGYSYPIALEGALKLKEIAYIHAEGYAAGELKHGPIAMIDREMVVVVLAPKDAWREKTVSNLQEVKARGAVILGIGDPEDHSTRSMCDHWISLPAGAGGMDESLAPFLLAPVIQLLSYEIAVSKGTDVDKPRNLAKSVTVE